MDKNIPSWSQYFMEIAKTVATRSKDPSTKVGCVIVDKDNHIIGTGYNGFVKGCVETPEMWERPEKYQWVTHSELNCLLSSTRDTKGATLYTTLYPCPECSKAIAAAGIKKVYYKDHELNGKSYLASISQDIFKRCGVEVVQVK